MSIVKAYAPGENLHGLRQSDTVLPARNPASPFRYFNSSPEIIRFAVLMYVRNRV